MLSESTCPLERSAKMLVLQGSYLRLTSLYSRLQKELLLPWTDHCVYCRLHCSSEEGKLDSYGISLTPWADFYVMRGFWSATCAAPQVCHSCSRLDDDLPSRLIAGLTRSFALVALHCPHP